MSVSGPRAFICDVYTRYWSELCRYLRTRCPGPIEPQDIAQQAFMRFAALAEPQSVRNPRAFLYRVAINTMIDQRRALRRRERITDATDIQSEQHTADSEPDRILCAQDELRVVAAAIGSLAERDRRLIALNRIEGLSFAEIARRTGEPRSSVRFIVERAVLACRAALLEAERRHSRSLVPATVSQGTTRRSRRA